MNSHMLLTFSISLLISATVSAGETDTPARPKAIQAVRPMIVVQTPQTRKLNLQELTKELQEATRDYSKTQQTKRAAEQKLSAAMAALKASTNEDEKKKNAEQVLELTGKVEAARKSAAAALVKYRQISQSTSVLRMFAYQNLPPLRKNADPQDPIERFAVLTPGGPVIVQVSLTIDGKPYRTVQHELVSQMISEADADRDGKLTWDEALDSPVFTQNRLTSLGKNQRDLYRKYLDENENGLVELDEARTFIARLLRVVPFTVSGYGNAAVGGGQLVYQNRANQADLKSLLDTDNNGELSAKELAAVEEVLKSRDADDNDLLYPQEISTPGVRNFGQQRQAVNSRTTSILTVMLGPSAEAESLFAALLKQYGGAQQKLFTNSFPAATALFQKLDTNSDGELQQNEVLTMNKVTPGLQLAVDLGGNAPKGISLTSASTKISTSTQENIVLNLPGVTLKLRTNLTVPRTVNYAATANRYITQYDKDNNGYLEKKELAGNLQNYLRVWDLNKDGKIYAKEITASYQRQTSLQQTSVRVFSTVLGNSLFQAIDQSGDNRLSLREMKTAAIQLQKLDINKDNVLTTDEIPDTYTVTFGLGTTGYQNPYTTRMPGRQQAGQNKNDQPEWFTRMDRNGDGDLTLKEFLGDQEDFEKLDTNSDGFIEPKEAKAAAE